MSDDVVEFPSLDALFEAVRLFARDNSLSPAELADMLALGAVHAQVASGRRLQPLNVVYGRRSDDSTPTQGVAHG